MTLMKPSQREMTVKTHTIEPLAQVHATEPSDTQPHRSQRERGFEVTFIYDSFGSQATHQPDNG